MTQAFNLSQLANNVNTSGQLNVATGVTGTQSVANGGTGQSTYTDGQLLIGNSTGNTLTKATITAGSGITVTNGSGAITIAASGGGSLQTEIFTAPGTWTKPASTSVVRVTVAGGGGGSRNPGNTANGSPGGTSSFGSLASATGGSGQVGSPGNGTISTGTTLRTTGVNNATSPFIAGGFASPGQPAKTYSISSASGAGQVPPISPIADIGFGGVAMGIVPVNAPVSITVGAGGAGAAGGSGVGGVSGAIVVEYVG